MNQALRAIDTRPPNHLFHAVELVVAVGMDGRAVVVNVLEGNQDLLHDVTAMEAAMALWPSPIPRSPGLYLFSGHSQMESLDASGEDYLKEVFHRCTYRRIGAADLARLR